MGQLALNFEPGLAQKYRDLRECFASCVYARGLGRVAAALDVAPSNLSAALSGERNLDCSLVEKYMQHFGDTTPAVSVPGTNGTGGRVWCLPATTRLAAKPTPAAFTPMRTPSGVSGGSGMSDTCSVSNGPYAVQSRARMG